MPIVQMPDGALVDMPDNPDPALLAELERLTPKADSPLKHQAKLIGSDVAKGALGLPAMAFDAGRDLLNIPFNLGEKIGEKLGGAPAPDFKLRGPVASTALQDFGTKPRTEAEKWQSVLTQGAVGGIASPGGLTRPLLQAGTGAASAGGSEIAARLGGDNIPMRLLGGLAGGASFAGIAGLANRGSPRVAELARESLDGVSPDQLKSARSFMEGARKNGMPLDYAQALEATGAQPSGMRVLRDTLANVKEGDATQALLKEQPGRLQDLSERWMGNQPGKVFSPEQAANNLSEAATGSVNAAKKLRSDTVTGLYEKAGNLPPETGTAMLKFLDDFVSKPGISDTTKAAAAGLRRKLEGPDTTGELSGLVDAWKSSKNPGERAKLRLKINELTAQAEAPNTLHAKDVNTMIGQFVGDFKGTPLSPANPVVRGETKAIGQGLNKILRTGSKELAAADDAFGQISRDVVDPLKQGQVGGLAGRAGYDAGKQVPVSRMNALFSAGRDPAAKHSPLLETARTLNKQDPTAFADAAKTYYSGKISEAFDAGIGAGGRATNKDAGQRIYNSLFADSKQYTGMRDVVTATAEAAGRKPAEALRGLENFAKIVRATRSQPDSIGGMTQQQIMEMAQKHYGANAVRIFGFLPFERMARNMESATMSRTFREMDKLITTPEGVDILIELSKTPVMDRRTLALAATAGGMLQQVGKNGGINQE